MKENIFKSLIVVLILAGSVTSYILYSRYNSKENSIVESVAVKEEMKGEVVGAGIATRYDGYPDINFEEYLAQNNEVIGWIKIIGTNIDYPILRNNDSTDPHDDYYLNYNIDGSKGFPGTIYVEPCTSIDLDDVNNLIYGHNLNDGTMFTQLHKYEDKTFFEEHPYVYIRTLTKSAVYKVTASVLYDDRHILANYDFTNQQMVDEFVESIKSNGKSVDIISEDFSMSSEGRYITLSTCTPGANDEERYIVIAVLVEEE